MGVCFLCGQGSNNKDEISLLWTNPSPDTNPGSNYTTINLLDDLSNYDILIFRIREYAGKGNYYYTMAQVSYLINFKNSTPSTYTTYPVFAGYNGDTNRGQFIFAPSNTTLTYLRQSAGEKGYNIIQEIYGVKTKLLENITNLSN